MTFYWTQKCGYNLPANAVHAGNDSDGDTIYVGRAHHMGDVVPVKVMQRKNIAYMSYNGREISTHQYEILCGQGLSWVPSAGGVVVPGAVPGGHTSNGETLYIGRGRIGNSLTPGKIHPSHRCLYVPYGEAEQSLSSYEILISCGESWVQSSNYSSLPPNAVFAGQDTNGDQIYVGRTHHGGDQVPVKIIPQKRAAFISYAGQEIMVNNYEVLCGSNYRWVQSSSGHAPPNAVSSGNTAMGEPLYIGRAHFQGSLTPGKVHPSHGCMYLPYGGAEHRVHQYEVLTRM